MPTFNDFEGMPESSPGGEPGIFLDSQARCRYKMRPQAASDLIFSKIRSGAGTRAESREFSHCSGVPDKS